MRLVCPNCDAQYEVDDSLVPAEGRDVQCSNCTSTWFQHGPGQEIAEPEEPQDEEVAEEIAEPEVAEPVATDPETPEEDPADDTSDEETLAAAAAAIAGTAATPSSKMDPEALEVIHEEVERETRARQAESGGLETQTDLGLEDVESEARASAARDRMARRRGIPTHTETEDTTESDEAEADFTASEANTKGELLPDIEEINSTLADAPDPVAEDGTPAASAASKAKRSRRGFRIGFGLMLLLFAGLILLYAIGPELGKSVPALAGPLESFRGAADSARVGLDGAAQTLVEQINGLIGRISSN